ncbi:MAG: hypothetical protein JRJ51_07255 [Deltaproteobacteria bacterium]|nr:hypothetical protein [Deltaproteobacteria bacterium]
MSTIHSRTRKGGQITGRPALTDGAVFDSSGVTAITTVSDADVTAILARYSDVNEVGAVGVDEVEAAAGNATTVITVPAGKYWRLVGLFHSLITDATVANRELVVTLRDTGDSTIEAITHAVVAASTTAKRTTLFALTNVGDAEDKASAADYPAVGPYLQPGEDVVITVTLGEAGDTVDSYLFFVEYDNDPR